MKDNQKKRRFNVIDLLVLIVVVLGVAFVGFKIYSSNIDETTREEVWTKGMNLYHVTFYANELRTVVADQLEEGSPVTNADGKADLGTAFSVEIGAPVSVGTSAEGQLVSTEKPGYNSVYITSEFFADETDYGFAIENGAILSVGDTLSIRCGKVIVWVQIVDIVAIDPADAVVPENAVIAGAN